LVSAAVAVTEREAGARPLLCSELDVNDLFCNSERKKTLIHYIVSLVEKKVTSFLEV